MTFLRYVSIFFFIFHLFDRLFFCFFSGKKLRKTWSTTIFAALICRTCVRQAQSCQPYLYSQHIRVSGHCAQYSGGGGGLKYFSFALLLFFLVRHFYLIYLNLFIYLFFSLFNCSLNQYTYFFLNKSAAAPPSHRFCAWPSNAGPLCCSLWQWTFLCIFAIFPKAPGGARFHEIYGQSNLDTS